MAWALVSPEKGNLADTALLRYSRCSHRPSPSGQGVLMVRTEVLLRGCMAPPFASLVW